MFKKNSNFSANSMDIVNIKCSADIPVSKLELLNQHFGHCRFIYNWEIDYNKERHKNNETASGYHWEYVDKEN